MTPSVCSSITAVGTTFGKLKTFQKFMQKITHYYKLG
jgi:hypothetical protein